MRNPVRTLANLVAAWRLKRRLDFAIAPTARVNYLGIRRNPPAALTVGEGTIFNGSISADRPEAKVCIGRNTFVGSSSLICATRIDIGDDVLISWGCTIVDHHSHSALWEERQHDVRDWYAGRKNWDNVKIAPVKICDRVWIGFQATVLCGVTVGEGAVIGCGSVVTKDVAPYSLVAGIPAKVIRRLQ